MSQKTEYESKLLGLKEELSDQVSAWNARMKVVEEEWNEKYKRVVIANLELDGMIKDEKRKGEQISKEMQKVRIDAEQKLTEEREKWNERF
jgi:hypothetical protein